MLRGRVSSVGVLSRSSWTSRATAAHAATSAKVGTVRSRSSASASASAGGREGTEVGGLHRPRAAAGDDEVAGARQRVAEGRGVGERLVGAGEGVPAHDPDDPGVADHLGEGVGHRVVVDGPQQRDEGVVGGGGVPRPLVRPGVGGRGVARPAQPGVELVRLVERRPVGVHRGVRVGGEDERAVGAQVGGQVVRHPPAEDDEALDVVAGEQRPLPAAQVEVLQPQPPQRPTGCQGVVEVGQGLDLAHPPNLPTASTFRGYPECRPGTERVPGSGRRSGVSPGGAARPDASVAGEPVEQRHQPAPAPRPRLVVVGEAGELQAGVDAEPPQRLGLPPR